MGLYGTPRDEREELKGEIQKLMNDYAEEIIDGDTYQKKMMDLTHSFQDKHNKQEE